MLIRMPWRSFAHRVCSNASSGDLLAAADVVLLSIVVFPLHQGLRSGRRLGCNLVGGRLFSGGFDFASEGPFRSEEHTSELQSLMRISYAVFCLKKKTPNAT